MQKQRNVCFYVDKQRYLYYTEYTKGGKNMFYDIYLDEVFYLREEKLDYSTFKPDVFNGLNRYNRKDKKNFRNGKITIVNKEKDIEKFLKISRNVLSNNEKLYYGKLSKEVCLNIKNITGYNLKNFNLSLQSNIYKHITKKHGNIILENKRCQSNITDYDFFFLPTIITEADSILKTHKTEYNNKAIKFIKKIDNITYHLIAYISFKKHNLEIKTFYKKRK